MFSTILYVEFKDREYSHALTYFSSFYINSVIIIFFQIIIKRGLIILEQ